MDMNNKRVIINMLVILAAFMIFTLWYDSSNIGDVIKVSSYQAERQTGGVAVNPTYKIYLISNEKQFQFWEYMNQGAADMAELLKLSYTWDAPLAQNIDQQIEILNKAVNNGADAILISATDPEKLSESIREAKAKGVKIVYVNTPANEKGIVTLTTDNYNAGKIAGENMLEELELLGVQQGLIGIISVNQTIPTIRQRDSGFIDAIKADGRFTILGPVYTDGDPAASEKAAASMIKENPDLKGMFGSNEGASVGVGNAIKADNNRIVGIAFDKSDATMKLLEGGSFKAIIAQNPYTMGYLGVAEAYAALKGYQTGPSYINTGVSVIRKR